MQTLCRYRAATLRHRVKLERETVWLTLDQMATLFQRNKSTISRHVKNVLERGELEAESVVAKNATTTQHGALKGRATAALFATVAKKTMKHVGE